MKTAIVGLGWWGQELVTAVQADGELKSDKVCFTTGVVRTPAKAKDNAVRQGLALTRDFAALGAITALAQQESAVVPVDA